MFPAIPAAAEPLVDSVSHVFTRPTFRRFVLLMSGLIVTMGRRTVSHVLVPIEPMLHGHWSDYHRIYSAARFSMWSLGAALVRQVIRLLPKDIVIQLVADDTVNGKDGDRVWAKGTHRDSSHSSRKVDQMTFGHKWLVLCVLVRLNKVDRPWALPVLCGLCISPKVAQEIGSGSKTPSEVARQLLIVLMRWLPDRKFILIGDYQVITHQTAMFARRHGSRVTVIGRLRGDANFYAEPTSTQRRRRVRGGGYCSKGAKRPSPSEQVEKLARESREVAREVAWYGGSRRTVRFVSETALWFSKQNCGVVPIRWVAVLEDHKEHDYFYSSDATLSAATIIELYALRWNIEVTFEETKGLLGLETTRHWCRQSVLRVTPLIFGLFTAVALIWNQLPASLRRHFDSRTPCYNKAAATFADALFAVRRQLWEHTLLRHRHYDQCLNRLPRPLRQTILWHLAAAA